MATKPSGDVTFTWATDVNFSSGPAVGNPTKVDPAGWTVVAQGAVPGNGIVAEFTNKVRNVLGQWTGWLDSGSFAGGVDAHLVETDVDGRAELEHAIVAESLLPLTALNFIETQVLRVEPLAEHINDSNYSPTLRKWFSCGGAGAVAAAYVGAAWQDMVAVPVTAGPSAPFQCIQATTTGFLLAPTTTGTAVTESIYRGNALGGALAAVAAANLEVGCDILFEPAFNGGGGRWIVCGEDTSANPGVWTSDDEGVTWTQRTVPDVNTGQRPKSLASSGSLVIMAGDDASGQYWRSSDGITWTEDTEVGGGAARLYSVTHNAVQSLFMMTDDEGTNIYTSSDGSTWAAVTTLPTAATGQPVEVHAIGPFFMAYQPSEAQPPPAGKEDWLWMTRDSGTTWEPFLPFSNRVHDHSIATTAVTNPVPHRVRVTPSGRLATWGHNTTDGLTMAVSLMPTPE